MNHRWICLATALAAFFSCNLARAESLDEVGDRLLSDPKIQVDLGVTKEQIDAVQMRRLKAILRLFVIAQLARECGGSAEGAEAVKAASPGLELNLDDLTAKQLARLRQLAYQLSLTEALQTNDAQVALGLTADQKRKLADIGKTAPNAAATAAGQAVGDKAGAKMKEVFDSAHKSDFDFAAAVAKIDKILNDAFASVQKVRRAARAQYDSEARERNDKALAVLTDDQRKRLGDLQGNPMR